MTALTSLSAIPTGRPIETSQPSRRSVWLGYGSRWTPNKEQSLLAGQENEIIATAREFYEVLVEAFPDVEDVLSGEIEPSELRGGGSRTSLLSSSTTIRALASAFHDLKFGMQWVDVGRRSPEHVEGRPQMTVSEIAEAFKELPSMASGSNKVLRSLLAQPRSI